MRSDGPVMPFHATFLTLAVPPIAAVGTLALLGASPIGLALIASVLAPAYGIGAAPAFLAGRLDAALARRGWSVPSRFATAAGLGALAGLVVLAPFYLTGMVGGAIPLFLPLACSAAAVAALGLALLLAWLVNLSCGKDTPRKKQR